MMPSQRTPQRDSSLMSRPLEWLTRAAIRFPLATLLLAVAAAGGSVWLTVTRLGFRTSRAELLNPNSEYNRRWLQYTKEFSDKEDVVVVVEGEGQAQIAPALDDVARALLARPDLFSAVLHNTNAPKLRSKGLYFLEPAELHQIDGFLDQAGPILRGDWSQLNLGGMAQWMGAAVAGARMASGSKSWPPCKRSCRASLAAWRPPWGRRAATRRLGPKCHSPARRRLTRPRCG